MKTIYILWLRQLKRYMRSTPRIVGSLAQPILYLLALGYGLGPVFSGAGRGDYIRFLAPGIIGMSIIFTSIFSGLEVIWDRQFGFLKETLVAPVSRLSIMLGRTLGGATVASVQGLLVLGISLIVGFRPQNWWMIIGVIPLLFLVALLFTSLGTLIASRLRDMQGFQLIINFLIMPLFFLSGALFPLEGASPTIALLASFNPLAYGIDGFRQVLLGVSHYGIGLDLLVLGACTAVFLWMGSYFFSKIEA